MTGVNMNRFVPPGANFSKVGGKGGKVPGMGSNFGPGKLRGVGKPSLGVNQAKLNQMREMAARQVAPLDLKEVPGGEEGIKKTVRENIGKEDSEKAVSLEKIMSEPEVPKLEQMGEKNGMEVSVSGSSAGVSSVKSDVANLQENHSKNDVQEQCRETILHLDSIIGQLREQVETGLAKYYDPSTRKFVDPKTPESAKDQKDLMNLSRTIQKLGDVQAELAAVMADFKADRSENGEQELYRETILHLDSAIGKLGKQVEFEVEKCLDPSTGKFVAPETPESVKNQEDFMNTSRTIQDLGAVRANLTAVRVDLKANQPENDVQEQCRETISHLDSVIGKLSIQVEFGLEKCLDPSTGKFVDSKTPESVKNQRDFMNASRVIKNLDAVRTNLTTIYQANGQDLQKRVSDDPKSVFVDMSRFMWNACQSITAFEQAGMDPIDSPFYEDYGQLKGDFTYTAGALKSQIDDLIQDNDQTVLRQDVRRELSRQSEELGNMGYLLDSDQFDSGNFLDTYITLPRDIPDFNGDDTDMPAVFGPEVEEIGEDDDGNDSIPDTSNAVVDIEVQNRTKRLRGYTGEFKNVREQIKSDTEAPEEG